MRILEEPSLLEPCIEINLCDQGGEAVISQDKESLWFRQGLISFQNFTDDCVPMMQKFQTLRMKGIIEVGDGGKEKVAQPVCFSEDKDKEIPGKIWPEEIKGPSSGGQGGMEFREQEIRILSAFSSVSLQLIPLFLESGDQKRWIDCLVKIKGHEPGDKHSFERLGRIGVREVDDFRYQVG
jgi:hypothetical protein